MADPHTLPDDLTALGWKLIARAPDRLFAVSVSWGGTVVSATLDEVIRNARAMTSYIERRNEWEENRRSTTTG